MAHVTELDVVPFAAVATDASAKDLDEYIKLNNQTQHIKLVKYIEDRLQKDIELFDYINEDSMDTAAANGSNGVTTNSATSDGGKSVQHQSEVNFLQSVFAWFGYFILKSYQPINDKVLSLLPQVK